jgi:glycine cleavage system protein P-like pyridoxal-binding family
MVEPTESETKAEIDRFITALLAIREEIRAVEKGEISAEDSPLRHAPHTVADLVATGTGNTAASRAVSRRGPSGSTNTGRRWAGSTTSMATAT